MTERKDWKPCSCATIGEVEDQAEQMITNMANNGQCIAFSLALGCAITRLAVQQLDLAATNAAEAGDLNFSLDVRRQVSDILHQVGTLDPSDKEGVERMVRIHESLTAVHAYRRSKPN